MLIVIGDFEISFSEKGKLWICKEGGEGMEIREEKLNEILLEIWNREF